MSELEREKGRGRERGRERERGWEREIYEIARMRGESTRLIHIVHQDFFAFFSRLNLLLFLLYLSLSLPHTPKAMPAKLSPVPPNQGIECVALVLENKTAA